MISLILMRKPGSLLYFVGRWLMIADLMRMKTYHSIHVTWKPLGGLLALILGLQTHCLENGVMQLLSQALHPWYFLN